MKFVTLIVWNVFDVQPETYLLYKFCFTKELFSFSFAQKYTDTKKKRPFYKVLYLLNQ